MFERICRPLVLSCLFVILVSGSTSIRPGDQQSRSRRYAACPSCRRERPDALVSWYPEQVRRDYRGLQPEVDQWPGERQYQPDPPFYSLYDRAVGSRRAPSFSRFGDPRQRENPVSVQRDINFDLAPAPTSSLRGLEGLSLDYQPRYQVPRSMAGSSYMKPSFYNAISRQSDPVPSSRYSDHGSSIEQRPFEGFRSFNAFEDRPKRPYQDYRAEDYPDRSFNNERPVVQPRYYPGRPTPSVRAPVTPRALELERFVPPRREQPRSHPATYQPQVNRNPYSLSPDPNSYQPTKNTGRDAEDAADDGNWRRQEVDNGWREPGRQEFERQQSRVEKYEDQRRAKMADEMKQGNGGRQSNGRFDPEVQQEEPKGKWGTIGENTNVEVLGKSNVSWSKLTKSSADVGSPEVVDRVTEPAEITTKPVIAA